MKKYAKETFLNNLENFSCDVITINPLEYWTTVKMLIKDKNCGCETIPPLL